MEYAISAGAVLIFSSLLMLFRGKLRRVRSERLDDGEFVSRLKDLDFSLPRQGSTSFLSRFKLGIRLGLLRIRGRRYEGLFDDIVSFKADILAAIKESKDLTFLPSAGGEARAVILMRCALESSDYEFIDERISAVLEEQNRHSTLTFCEIENMRSAGIYCVVERLNAILGECVTIARVYDVASRYVNSPNIPKRYKTMATSPLFLSICARISGYRTDRLADMLAGVMDLERRAIATALATLTRINGYDFSRYYTPLELLTKYDVFSLADPDAKRGFLTQLGRLSDKENIDEFLLTVRLDSYMQSASSGHIKVGRLNIFNRAYIAIFQKNDLSRLASSLTSSYMMYLNFGTKRSNKRKSITKILEFENTYEPIYRYKTVNFGISTKGGILKINPKLPSEVQSAAIVFTADGVEHHLTLERGEEKALYLGNTKLSGVADIRLSGTPLNIRLVIPKSDM